MQKRKIVTTLVIICVIMISVFGLGGTGNSELIPDADGEYFQDTNTGWYWYTDVAQFQNQDWSTAKANVEALTTGNLTWQLSSISDFETLNAYNPGPEIIVSGLMTMTLPDSSTTFGWLVEEVPGKPGYHAYGGISTVSPVVGVNETVGYIGRTVNIGAFAVSKVVVNSPPTAYDMTADIIKNTRSEIILGASDPNGDPLTYLQESSPSHAAAFLLNFPSPGSATYFSGVTFPGTDSFTFKVNDGLGDSNVATVTIKSAGYLVDPGDQTLTVTDLPAPVGVRIVTDPLGGPSPAQISLCSLPFPPIMVPAGADFTLTCGSATIKVLAGLITVPIDVNGIPVLVELDEGDYVTIDEQGTITNNGSLPTEILINGIPVTIEPGQTITIDSDFDGVPDAVDQCPNSNLNLTVVIDSCDTGVENQLFASGCTISDFIYECAVEANNHGQFVLCISHLTNDLKSEGIITGKEKGNIQNCAAQADIP